MLNGQIIKLLKEKSGFVSGEEISTFLGITRAAVWKKVKTLRQSGYVITAIPSKGYRLVKSPDIPTKEALQAVFTGDIIGREIIFYDVISSTNDKVMEIGATRSEGTVVIADAQKHGRGRFGRKWISPAGVNLYVTVLLKPPFVPKEATLITLMAAVAIVSAIRDFTGLHAVIKWPNDILIRNKKVAGILTEMKSDMDRIEFIAVGIGINVNMSLNMMPHTLRSVTASLKSERGKPINRVELLGAVLSSFDYWYKNILHGKRHVLLDTWQQLDSTRGEKVGVRMNERVISGIAQGISDEGELMIELHSGAVVKVCAGEVTLLNKKNHF